MNSRPSLAISLCLLFGLCSTASYGQTGIAAATPKELVAAYNSLADTILAANATELNLVQSILTTTYTHARATLGVAKAKIQAGENAREDMEKLAALVSQLGNEGDGAVAGIRKRLVEGGHHHNALGEQQGIYDEGFVVVTRAAKKVFLGAATEIGKQAGSPDLGSLEAQWTTVQNEFEALMKGLEDKTD
jgi:hypothetical protein